MTSAEFAATYKVLKTTTERGARSQIAQEVALGRMVMVHHLDVGSAIERQRLRAGVGALKPSAAAQVFGVYDVDGTTVVVTHFLSTFLDLPRWLADNAMPDDAKTLVLAAIPAKAPEPPPTPAPKAPAPPASAEPKPPAAPSFTEMFGAVKGSGSVAAPQPGEFTRQFQGIKPPPTPPSPSVSPSFSPPPAPAAPSFTSPASPPPPSATPTRAGESFSQVFGGMTSPPPAAPPPAPALSPSAPRLDAVISLQPPMAPRVETPAELSTPVHPMPDLIRRHVTEDQICVLTFDRPDSAANIFDKATLAELNDHINHIL